LFIFELSIFEQQNWNCSVWAVRFSRPEAEGTGKEREAQRWCRVSRPDRPWEVRSNYSHKKSGWAAGARGKSMRSVP